VDTISIECATCYYCRPRKWGGISAQECHRFPPKEFPWSSHGIRELARGEEAPLWCGEWRWKQDRNTTVLSPNTAVHE